MKKFIEKFDYDDATKKAILFYIIIEKTIINEKQTEAESIEKTKEQDDVDAANGLVDASFEDENPETIDEQESNQNIQESITTASPIDEFNISSEFETLIREFNELKSDNRNLINDYLIQYEALSDISLYEQFIRMSDQDFDLMFEGRTDDVYKNINSIRMVVRLINKIKTINEAIEDLKNRTPDYDDLELLNMEINELKNIIVKIHANQIGPVFDSTFDSQIYFAHDLQGNPFIPALNAHDQSSLGGLITFIKKINAGDSSNNWGIAINKIVGMDDYVDIIKRDIFVAGTSKNYISFIKINQNGKEKIMVISVVPVNNNNNIIAPSTGHTIFQNNGEINRQIKLLEMEDPNEMELQKNIFDGIIKSSQKNTGGNRI